LIQARRRTHAPQIRKILKKSKCHWIKLKWDCTPLGTCYDCYSKELQSSSIHLSSAYPRGPTGDTMPLGWWSADPFSKLPRATQLAPRIHSWRKEPP
jgi:hypothetical protein